MSTELISNLTKTLENLPSLSERLQTWNKLIKELHQQEVIGLESCIREIQFDGNTSNDLKSYLELLESTKNYYSELFSLLINRIDLPILAYTEKINEIENKDFSVKLKQFRIDAHKQATEKAIELASGYFEAYRPTLAKSERQYILECQSLVTGFLFTTPFFECKGEIQRKLYVKEFTGWDPNSYCLLFYKKLNELFKKSDT